MGALVAVAVGGTGADGRVADVVARKDAAVAVRAVMRREDVHHVVHARADRGGAQLVGHAPVVGEAGVLGENGDLVLVGVLIGAGRRNVERDHVLHVLGQPGRAVADLLIGGEVGVDLARKLRSALAEGLHRRQQHRGAGLVVHEAGLDVAARHAKARLERDHVSGLDAELAHVLRAPDLLIEHDADVRAEVGRGAAQLLLRHVDGIRRAADGAGIDPAIPRVHAYVLRHAVEGVEPAHRADVQRPVRVHVAHHEADVVQVGRDAQGVPLAAEISNHAALVGLPVRIAQLVEQAAQHALHLLVLAGGAVRRQQAFKAFQAIALIKGDHVLLPSRPSGGPFDRTTEAARVQVILPFP